MKTPTKPRLNHRFKEPLRALLKSPLWLLELLTGAKSFRDNPLIGNYWLNKAGLHIIRMVIAHGVMNARMFVLGWRLPHEDRTSYRQQGYIIKENFLDDSHFAEIIQEIRHFQRFQEQSRAFYQGDTETRRLLLTPHTLQALPHTAKLCANPLLNRLLHHTNGHRRQPFFNIERIHNGINTNQHTDPQKDLHTDTFHPTMKFWLYLDDVTAHNGPFTYVPGSNRLSMARLRWEYRMSLCARQHPNRLAGRGSFRFSRDDIKAIGLPEPQAFQVKKNTLLIANTFGIHGRGQADTGSTRLAIWGMGRTNPFIPFPGTGLAFFDRYQYKVLKWLKK